MSKRLDKIKLTNYKRFSQYEITLQKGVNVFIGDNEVGKSSILSAVDYVLSGSKSKVETDGIDAIINSEAVKAFMNGDKNPEKLPIAELELYIKDLGSDPKYEILFGENNTDKKKGFGLKMLCAPNLDYGSEIKDSLAGENACFPFEFYEIVFETFSGQRYTSYFKPIRHLLLDNASISADSATKDFVRRAYEMHILDEKERAKHKHAYRQLKSDYSQAHLKDLNDRVPDYSFGLKNGVRSSLEGDLTILIDDISVENRGRGQQVLIKTDFALHKPKHPLDILLIEEPENHLSHVRMYELIEKIKKSQDQQLLISTHSNMISSRLDLRNCHLVSNPVINH